MKRKMICFYLYVINELCNFDKFEKLLLKINFIKIVYIIDICNVMYKVNINICLILVYYLFVLWVKKDDIEIKIRLD